MREFEVWAPRPDRVELVLDGERVPMNRAGDGWWRTGAEAGPGATYGYSLDGGPPRGDPRALRLPEGPHGPSQVFDPGAFAWTDAKWAGIRLEEAVVYELHVGTFTPEGTLDSAVERLDHLVDLGVTLVELLPLSPFPGRHGWGYDGVAPYAVHEPYGGPEALQRFVDAAHGRGLGVCLDLVYNHLGPDGNYLAQFGPYLTDKHGTPWGDAVNLDAEGSDEVRAWVLDNLDQWLRDFHVDAVRLDAVHELHDDRAVHILEDLGLRADAVTAATGVPRWLIAESDRNDPRTVTPRERGGLGIHAQWADDVHHALHVALTGEGDGYYGDFATPGALAKALRTPFFHDGTYSTFRGRAHGRPVVGLEGWRFVVCLQNHDQIGNRATGDRLSASVSQGRLACGAALLLTAPYTPMLFMGEEWGAGTPWQFFTDHTDTALQEAVSAGRRAEFSTHGGWDAAEVPDPQDPATFERSRLDWDEPRREPQARLLGWYRELIALRRSVPDLRDPELGDAHIEHDPGRHTFHVRRGLHHVLVNLSTQNQTFEASGSVLAAWNDKIRVEHDQVELPPESAAILAS